MKTRIDLPSVKPGMRLSEAVRDDADRVLVPDGTVLTESLLLSLQRREVAALWVDLEVEEDPAQREARRVGISRSIAVHFRQAGDGLGTRILRDAILAFRMGRSE